MNTNFQFQKQQQGDQANSTEQVFLGLGNEIKDSNLFSSNVETDQCQTQQKITKRNYKTFRKAAYYNWNDTENRRYIVFLIKKKTIFDLSLKQRLKLRINVQMSKLVKTRNPVQCHTHHQKLIAKYGSIDAIIENNKHLLQFSKKLSSVSKTHAIAMPQSHCQSIGNQDYQSWHQYLS